MYKRRIRRFDPDDAMVAAQKLVPWTLFRKLPRHVVTYACEGDFQSLVQDCLLRVWEDLPGWEADLKLSTYVCNSTRWTVLRKCQRRKTQQALRLEFVARVPDKAYDPTEELENSDLPDLITDLLRQALPPLWVQIVRARYGLDDRGSGLTLKETGKLFQKTRERISQLEGYSIRKLQCWEREPPLRSLRPPRCDEPPNPYTCK